jgi:anthranilate phosphoribosyltransferase
MEIQQALARLVAGEDLAREDMAAVMGVVMSGGATEAQVGGLLVALRMKGETAAEIAGAAEVMRELATPVAVTAPNPVDLVGTGGDGANLFNVSTAATFVVAAAGGHVAKHGNRSVSSTSGSSDVLEILGAPLDLSPAQVGRAVDEVGVGFMFAPAHHSAMRHAIGPRRELGMRTLFNVLGPLTNPAGVRRQVLGVFSADLCPLLVEVLQELGSEHVMVLHSEDGLDEISLAAPTLVSELRDGLISSYRIHPGDFGLEPQSLDGLSVQSSDESARLIRAALGGRGGRGGRGGKGGEGDERARRAGSLIALNAGACIYVAGIVATLADGVAMAEDLVASGQAGEKLREFVTFTQLMREQTAP